MSASKQEIKVIENDLLNRILKLISKRRKECESYITSSMLDDLEYEIEELR